MGEPGTEQTEQTAPRRHFRDWCLWAFAALIAVSAVSLRVSVMNAPVRFLLAATIAVGILTWLLYLIAYLNEHPRLFFPVVFFALLLLTWAVLGNKPPNVEMLRRGYVRRLSAFEGAGFLRGGETKSGVDSPGLARAALWETMLKQGITQVNPRLLGPTLWKFWWRDMSARDLVDGKHGYTRVIGHAPKLAGYDTRRLQLGDMAIAGNTHVLIYYGQGRWMEANPDEQRVVVNEASAASRRPWFGTPVTIVRWWIFEPS